MALLDPTTAPPSLQAFFATVATQSNADLSARLAVTTPDYGRLQAAMAYAVLGGGKRIRPVITHAAAAACGLPLDAMRARCAADAVEMLHAYTLVHDDLPAMDDDDLRRGRPTVHIAFGEAIAILAGDGLLTLALATLCDLDAQAGPAVRTLAHLAGHRELLAGQAIDLTEKVSAMDFNQLQVLHAKKTGALFQAAAELGALAAQAAPAAVTAFGQIGMHLGVAFQHADDIDDNEFSEHRAAARAAVALHCAAAIALATPLNGSRFVELAEWIEAAVASHRDAPEPR